MMASTMYPQALDSGVRCGNHGRGTKVYHASAAEVRECYQLSREDEQRAAAEHAAERAVERFFEERGADETYAEEQWEAERGVVQFGDALRAALHEAPKAAQAKVTEDGIYRDPTTGEIFKVQWNRASGDGRRLYAKQLWMWRYGPDGYQETKEIPLDRAMWYGDAGPESGSNGSNIDFRYVPGAMAKLRAEWRLTKEEARQFGALYGTCVRCGRTLTLEESIDRAMGPVCYGKQFS